MCVSPPVRSGNKCDENLKEPCGLPGMLDGIVCKLKSTMSVCSPRSQSRRNNGRSRGGLERPWRGLREAPGRGEGGAEC